LGVRSFLTAALDGSKWLTPQPAILPQAKNTEQEAEWTPELV